MVHTLPRCAKLKAVVRIGNLADTRERFDALGFNPAPVMRAK